MAFGKLSGAELADHSAALQVTLVAAEYNVWIVTVGVTLELFDPVLYLEERPFVGEVKDQQKAHGVAIKGGGEAAKALLTCGVPEL